MELTSLGLRKPDGTDPVDIQDFNDNADLIDRELKNRPETDGNASDMTVSFTEAKQLTELVSDDSLSGLFAKLKLAVKNVINIVKLLGTTDISALGDGTVTGALSILNTGIADCLTPKVLYSGDAVIPADITTEITLSDVREGAYMLAIEYVYQQYTSGTIFTGSFTGYNGVAAFNDGTEAYFEYVHSGAIKIRVGKDITVKRIVGFF